MVTLKLTVRVAGVYHGVQSEGEVHVVMCDLRGCGTCRMLLLRYLGEPKMKNSLKLGNQKKNYHLFCITEV